MGAKHSLHDAEGVQPRQHEDSDRQSHECMDAESNQDGSHVQAEALEQCRDVASLQDGLRDERCNADRCAVNHQVNLQDTHDTVRCF